MRRTNYKKEQEKRLVINYGACLLTILMIILNFKQFIYFYNNHEIGLVLGLYLVITSILTLGAIICVILLLFNSKRLTRHEQAVNLLEEELIKLETED